MHLFLKFVFWNKTLHVSDSSSVPHQACSQAVSTPVWHIPLLCVQWKNPDDGQRNCPKHVEFYSKIKFGELVHLVGFIIRIAYCMSIFVHFAMNLYHRRYAVLDGT